MSSTPEWTVVQTGVLPVCEGDALVALVVDAVERLGIEVEIYLRLWEAGVCHNEIEEYLGFEGGMSLEHYGVARRGGFSHTELMELGSDESTGGTMLGRYLRLVLAGWPRDKVVLLEEKGLSESMYAWPGALGVRRA
jgi:hypothetical protein